MRIRIGAVVIAPFFHQCALSSIPGLVVIRRLSLLVLYSTLRGFSPSTPVFPSAQKRHFIWLDLDLKCDLITRAHTELSQLETKVIIFAMIKLERKQQICPPLPSTGCPGASRCTNGASCAVVHVLFSGGVIMDRNFGWIRSEPPSFDSRVSVTFCVEGSSPTDSKLMSASLVGPSFIEVSSGVGVGEGTTDWVEDERHTAPTTHWREERAGKSCNRSLNANIHDVRNR